MNFFNPSAYMGPYVEVITTTQASVTVLNDTVRVLQEACGNSAKRLVLSQPARHAQ
ncbi:hypothetical protein YB2330_003935 [Saitoella coloradoensis]